MLATPYKLSISPPRLPIAKHGVTAVVVHMLMLVPGTGGAMTPQSASQLGRWVYNPVIHVEPSSKGKYDQRSPAEQISSIRDVYGLNMSELAALLGVSRPTVYAWLNGQEPKHDSLVHIHRLASATREIEDLQVARIDKLVRRPIFQGRSLLDKIKANDDIVEALTVIKSIAIKEGQARCRQKGSGKNRQSIDAVGTEYSVPAYDRS